MASDKAKRANSAENKKIRASGSSLSNDADATLWKLPPVQGRTGGPTRRSTKGGWTPEEDEILRRAVQCFKGKNWKKIAELLTDRTDVQCLHRWQKVLNPDLVKGPWTKAEDERIMELVDKYGAKKWSAIAQSLPGRIGKQCRERWHNHLNPGINKEAWNQEEELALIRAHQIYGNKWAELAKFLPGRTHNAIKNHWNSSIKKKLDSYLASGMLTEIPKLSISQSMMMCASTTSAETSGDRIVEAAMEEISECSQDSSATGCYHSGSFEAATTSPVGHEIFELQKAGEDGILNDELKDLTEHHLSKCSKTDGASLESEGEIGLSEVPIDQEVQTVTSNEMNEFFQSVIAGSSCSVGSPRECTNTVNVSDCVGSSCFRVQPFVPTAVAEHMMTSSFSYTYQLSSSIDMVATSPSLCANPFSVSGSPLHSVAYDTMLSSLVNTGGASCSPEIPASAFNSSICNDGGYLQCASEFYRSDQLSQDCLPLIQDLKIDTRDEQPRPAVCSLSSIANGINQCNRMAEISNIETENADTGSLFYEPPRLPNWDMPFVNCDLISTCNYLQQAYSPLGVRQMIMSSVNCSTPAYFPWNSPCNDKSPEAVLKSAAKSFANTPSILRKRQREASTPVHRNQSDKKVDNVPDYDCFFTPTSSVQKDCALLRSAAVHLRTCSVEDGAIFSSNERGIILSPPYCLKSRSTAAATSEEKHIDYDSENSKQLKAVYEGCNANIEEGPCCSESSTRRIDRGVDAMDRMNGETVLEKVKTSGVLVEQNMNGNDLFTPGGNISLKHSSPNSCRGTPKTLFARRMEMSSKSGDSKGHLKRIQGTACFPCVISPNLCEKKQDIRADNVTSSFETSAARSPIDNVFDKDWLNNVPDLDSFNIMSATFNLDKDLGSPLEWKSPWSLDTPLSAHKDGTDGIFEDMGIFINNSDGSDDALGLMKELNEHVASSYMEAEEVLNGEHAKRLVAKTITSTKSSKASLSEDKTSCKENINFSDQNFQGENCTTISNYNPANYSSSNINAINTPSRGGLSEGQMNQSFVGNISDFSSPSLYLLRECR